MSTSEERDFATTHLSLLIQLSDLHVTRWQHHHKDMKSTWLSLVRAIDDASHKSFTQLSTECETAKDVVLTYHIPALVRNRLLKIHSQLI